jgi:hypothetical protein
VNRNGNLGGDEIGKIEEKYDQLCNGIKENFNIPFLKRFWLR